MKVIHYLSFAWSLAISFALFANYPANYPLYLIKPKRDVAIDFQVFVKCVLNALQTRDDKSPINTIIADSKKALLKSRMIIEADGLILFI